MKRKRLYLEMDVRNGEDPIVYLEYIGKMREGLTKGKLLIRKLKLWDSAGKCFRKQKVNLMIMEVHSEVYIVRVVG